MFRIPAAFSWSFYFMPQQLKTLGRFFSPFGVAIKKWGLSLHPFLSCKVFTAKSNFSWKLNLN
jgi:hypothetical protein